MTIDEICRKAAEATLSLDFAEAQPFLADTVTTSRANVLKSVIGPEFSVLQAENERLIEMHNSITPEGINEAVFEYQETRISELEKQVSELEKQVAELRKQLETTT